MNDPQNTTIDNFPSKHSPKYHNKFCYLQSGLMNITPAVMSINCIFITHKCLEYLNPTDWKYGHVKK